MVRMQLEFVRHQLVQFVFHREHVLAGADAGAVGDAENMRIDSDRRFAECNVEYDVGGLAPYARQPFEFLARRRHCAGMVFKQQLAQR